MSERQKLQELLEADLMQGSGPIFPLGTIGTVPGPHNTFRGPQKMVGFLFKSEGEKRTFRVTENVFFLTSEKFEILRPTKIC